MTELGVPYTLDEMVAAFEVEGPVVHDFFRDISEEQFFAAPPEVWTPADNLVHLIKSVNPLIMGLRLPKVALRLRFGRAKGPSRSLAAIRDEYLNVTLAGGAVSTGQYNPEIAEATGAERVRILTKWSQKADEMVKVLSGWNDADLDKINVPHPAMGDMTLRDILLFTLYHNLHHVNDVSRLLNRPEQEWFR